MGDAAVRAVLEVQRAWEEGPTRKLVDVMHPDIEWIDESRPLETRTCRGFEQVGELYRTWLATWSTYEARHEELVDLGGGRFYLPVWERGRGKSSGVDVERFFGTIFEVSDGRVVKMHTFSTRAEARAAAGLTAKIG